jgi:hypothetical protein
MGNEDARKRSQKLAAEINHLALEVYEIAMALTQANGEKTKAQATAKAEEERQRQEALTNAVSAYYAEVQKIDQALEKLATRCKSADEKLQSAESLMSPDERTPIQQLYSLFGRTLAAAHFGLGD